MHSCRYYVHGAGASLGVGATLVLAVIHGMAHKEAVIPDPKYVCLSQSRHSHVSARSRCSLREGRQAGEPIEIGGEPGGKNGVELPTRLLGTVISARTLSSAEAPRAVISTMHVGRNRDGPGTTWSSVVHCPLSWGELEMTAVARVGRRSCRESKVALCEVSRLFVGFPLMDAWRTRIPPRIPLAFHIRPMSNSHHSQHSISNLFAVATVTCCVSSLCRE